MAHVLIITDKKDSSWSTTVNDKMTPSQCLKYFEQWNRDENMTPFHVLQVVHTDNEGNKTTLNTEYYANRYESRVEAMKALRESGYGHIAALLWDSILKSQQMTFVKPEKIFIS